MRIRTVVLAAGLAACAAGARAQPAQSQGRMSPQEIAQLLDAAHLTQRGSDAVNQCGRPASARFAFTDLNGDGRPEAIIGEIDPACHGGTGEKFSVLWRDPAGRWNLVGAGLGRMMLLQTRTQGWRDYSLEGGGCQPAWGWDGARYIIQKPCPAAGARTAGAAPAPPPPLSAGGGADREAAFRAAGFPAVRGRHPACDKSQEATIEVRDLNGDGRLDAVVGDNGTECYGATEQGFVIVTKDASGTWRKFYESQGIPDFKTTRGAGGWPDVEVGGPGFCHPVMRWNGSDYVTVRWRAENPGACAGRR